MKFSTTLATLVFASFVSANSGIFSPDGQVIPIQIEPSVVESRLVGSNRRDTNAERLRRGMSPLPPTRRSSGIRPRTSPVPCGLGSASGIIQISRASDGGLLGYIRKTFDGQKSYTYGTLENALVVTLPASPGNGAFDLVATNGPDAVHNNVGAVGGSGGFNFNPGSLGYAYLAGTGHSDANAPPSSNAGTSIQSLGYTGPAESQIWSLDCNTRALTAQWTNTDSTNPTTQLFYDPAVDFVGLVGDFDKFTSTFPTEGAILVTATFVPL
ncbi:hypothetical protein B0H19DRAFT_1111017 [Mycena capillaripes]|nr:hypothetical protein B0H19DRAFT_1111017 [Mycena capillaripes]